MHNLLTHERESSLVDISDLVIVQVQNISGSAKNCRPFVRQDIGPVSGPDCLMCAMLCAMFDLGVDAGVKALDHVRLLAQRVEHMKK